MFEEIFPVSTNGMTKTPIKLADEQLNAEISKAVAEMGQIKVRALLVPFLAAGGLIGATAVVVKILF